MGKEGGLIMLYKVMVNVWNGPKDSIFSDYISGPNSDEWKGYMEALEEKQELINEGVSAEDIWLDEYEN